MSCYSENNIYAELSGIYSSDILAYTSAWNICDALVTHISHLSISHRIFIGTRGSHAVAIASDYTIVSYHSEGCITYVYIDECVCECMCHIKQKMRDDADLILTRIDSILYSSVAYIPSYIQYNTPTTRILQTDAGNGKSPHRYILIDPVCVIHHTRLLWRFHASA